jgi:YggT family protein
VFENTRVRIGGADRDRTDDLLIANEALSQLSYSPTGPEEPRIIGSGIVLSSAARPGDAAVYHGKKPVSPICCRETPGSCSVLLAVVLFTRSPRRETMVALARLIDTLITLYIWLLIGQAILSWLITFNVINGYNSVVRGLGDFLWRITEPALRPIRRVVPTIGGIDVSPIVLILALYFLRDLIVYDLLPALS